VSREDPDVRVFVHLAGDRATVYLDLSGDPLHRRGYRRQTGEAPLRETLAAAILRMSGWDRQIPLVDPMCGSGTIAIEAAMWAANIAPGLSRCRFGFERWSDFNDEKAKQLQNLCGELRSKITGPETRILASDIDPTVMDIAKTNARAAGVRLAFRQKSVLELQRNNERRIVITNPPYGNRLEADPAFVNKLAGVISRLHGWQVCLLAGTDAYERTISLQPQNKTPLVNGNLDCNLLVYEVP
jgi:putative N6-adenine-specific DNA methylase